MNNLNPILMLDAFKWFKNTLDEYLSYQGTSTVLQIEDDQGNILYDRPVDESYMNYYEYSRHCTLLDAVVFPIRTDNIDDLIKDLMPLVNRSQKVGLDAIAMIGDCLTLPIRLLTLIPRIVYNHLYKHPLERFDLSDFPIQLNIMRPFWLSQEAFKAQVKEMCDSYSRKRLEKLQKAVKSGAVNVVVVKTEYKNRWTLQEGEPVQIVTTTRFKPFLKPSIEPLKVKQTVTTYQPLSFWGESTHFIDGKQV